MYVSSRSDPLQMMRQVADAEFNDDSSEEDDASLGVDLSSPTTNPASPEQHRGEPKEFSAKDAARATNCVGYVVLCLLLFCGAFLSILTHFYVQGEEEQDFEKGVRSI